MNGGSHDLLLSKKYFGNMKSKKPKFTAYEETRYRDLFGKGKQDIEEEKGDKSVRAWQEFEDKLKTQDANVEGFKRDLKAGFYEGWRPPEWAPTSLKEQYPEVDRRNPHPIEPDQEYLDRMYGSDQDVGEIAEEVKKRLSGLAVKFKIIHRGIVPHIDNCPIPARTWKDLPYANYWDDCTQCKYLLDADRDETGGIAEIMCIGHLNGGLKSAIEEFQKNNEL